MMWPRLKNRNLPLIKTLPYYALLSTFACYINERLTQDVPTALRTAAALVSLKMETPGPYMGTRCDAEAYLKELY